MQADIWHCMCTVMVVRKHKEYVMKSWMLKTVLLAIAFGLLLTGARMLRDAHASGRYEGSGVAPAEGARIYRQRLQETDRLINDEDGLSVSWTR